MRLGAFFWLVALCVLFGCSGRNEGHESARKMSERSRDSLIARSRLHGAGVMGRAIAVTDSAAARARRLDARTR